MSKLTFTLIQSNLHWENKQANLEMFSKKIESITKPTQVVMLPEMFSTGFSMNPNVLAEEMNGSEMQWLQSITAKHRIIVTGSTMIKENERFYNRLVWMLPNGSYGTYDKRHCFAYANEDKHYTAGNKQLITQVNGWKINTQICYDLRFPVWARQQKNNLYDALIYVANWPARRSYAWKSLLVARAIENQCYVLAVNRVGVDGNNIEHNGCSMVINPLGEVMYCKENEEDIFTITLDKNDVEEVRNKFPFYKDADDYQILL